MTRVDTRERAAMIALLRGLPGHKLHVCLAFLGALLVILAPYGFAVLFVLLFVWGSMADPHYVNATWKRVVAALPISTRRTATVIWLAYAVPLPICTLLLGLGFARGGFFPLGTAGLRFMSSLAIMGSFITHFTGMGTVWRKHRLPVVLSVAVFGLSLSIPVFLCVDPIPSTGKTDWLHGLALLVGITLFVKSFHDREWIFAPRLTSIAMPDRESSGDRRRGGRGAPADNLENQPRFHSQNFELLASSFTVVKHATLTAGCVFLILIFVRREVHDSSNSHFLFCLIPWLGSFRIDEKWLRVHRALPLSNAQLTLFIITPNLVSLVLPLLICPVFFLKSAGIAPAFTVAILLGICAASFLLDALVMLFPYSWPFIVVAGVLGGISATSADAGIFKSVIQYLPPLGAALVLVGIAAIYAAIRSRKAFARKKG